jgi:hypothetical protein
MEHFAKPSFARATPEEASPASHLRSSTRKAIILAPVVLVVLTAFSMAIPRIRAVAFWFLQENHPVELLTFAFLLGGGILGILVALKTKRSGGKSLVSVFYALFSTALILIAMEEVAWGQTFFGFETPTAWQSGNLQNETTLHNVVGLQGHSELFRLAYGLGTAVGIQHDHAQPDRFEVTAASVQARRHQP